MIFLMIPGWTVAAAGIAGIEGQDGARKAARNSAGKMKIGKSTGGERDPRTVHDS
jgi:hypothetical protein